MRSSGARTDRCGGRRATGVPTATRSKHVVEEVELLVTSLLVGNRALAERSPTDGAEFFSGLGFGTPSA